MEPWLLCAEREGDEGPREGDPSSSDRRAEPSERVEAMAAASAHGLGDTKQTSEAADATLANASSMLVILGPPPVPRLCCCKHGSCSAASTGDMPGSGRGEVPQPPPSTVAMHRGNTKAPLRLPLAASSVMVVSIFDEGVST